ncbi:hypothetical protein LTR17_025827 [Elasticomyces elasticus]|nr:hypothetical protein LTR17_025827 [Elasticomyces elasticus]
MPRTTQNSIRHAQVSVLDVALGLSMNIAPQIQIDRPLVTAVTAATSKSTVSLLLELPPELRNRIFELAVMVVTEDGDLSTLDTKQYQLESVKLRIALTNKQLHDEILPMFYAMHRFRFTARHFTSDDERIQPSMLLLGPESRAKVENSTKPVPESSLICFGVFDRLLSRWSESKEGDVIELPTFSLRKLLKRTELILLGPEAPSSISNTIFRGVFSSQPPKYTHPKRDWLYPLRNLRELGFSKLSELSIVIRYPRYIEVENYPENEQEIMQRFKKWVGEQTDIMELDRVAESVSIRYEQG